MRRYYLTLTIFFLIFLSAPAAYSADRITPSDVYQSTENLRLKLDALGLFDMQMYHTIPPDTALRHPRHVMQKVRECHQLFEKILISHDRQADPLPDMYSLREVRPADVKNGVDHLLRQLDKLSDTPIPVNAPYTDGKLPSDVYNNLKRICHTVKAEILPSDVFRVASVVADNMEAIYKSRDFEDDMPEIQTFTDKVPGDVYFETWDFLKNLRQLALNADYAIPGGVVLSNERPQGTITPQDVIALMGDALAETNAIKYSLYVRENTHLPPLIPSKTPSDVFGKIHYAHAIVQKLLTLETHLEKETEDR